MNRVILVIDDDDILRNGLKNGLTQHGFSMLTAGSADTASEILDKISVDAIMLDRMMPGMDGLSFLKKLRTSGNTTPIIMLTAMSGPENAIVVWRVGQVIIWQNPSNCKNWFCDCKIL